MNTNRPKQKDLNKAASQWICCGLPSVLPQDVIALPFEETFLERNLPSVGGFLKFLGFTAFLSVATTAGLVAYKKGLLPLR